MSPKILISMGGEKFDTARLIEEFLVEIGGDGTLDVLGGLTTPLTDNQIAKATGIKVTAVRSVLNKLYNYRITNYILV